VFPDFLERLKTARRLEKVLAEWAACVAWERRDVETAYFTSEEFNLSATGARRDFYAANPIYRKIPPDRAFVAASSEVRSSVEQLLMSSKKLSSAERQALDWFRGEYSQHAERSWRLIIWLFLAVIPGAVVVYFWFPHGPHVNHWMAALLAFAMAGSIPLYAGAILLSARTLLASKWAAASVRYRISRLALRLVGNNQTDPPFRPMRWVALVAFVIGSLLDLVASW